jgi:tetratricopeptide (TPR) repeat protein
VYLKKALDLAPQKQLILFELAQNAEAQGDAKAMLGYYADALNAAPSNDDARARYAAAAVRTKNDALADEIVAPFISGSGSVDTSLLKAYADRGQYGKVTALGEPYLKAHPSDVQGYVTLASVYYSVKDSEDTLAILKRAEEAVPSSKADIDGLIKQVEAGTAGN